MPINEDVIQPKPRYRATVSAEGVDITATITKDEVALQRGSGRAILHVSLDEWDAFSGIVEDVSLALVRKAQIEGDGVLLTPEVAARILEGDAAEPVPTGPGETHRVVA